MNKCKKINQLNLVAFTLLLSTFYSFASEGQLHFNQISVEDGLSHGAVYDIIKDEHGFMWFATKDGLTYCNDYNFWGLILCKEFISKNNGELKIESKAGSGSTFSFTLPLSK